MRKKKLADSSDPGSLDTGNHPQRNLMIDRAVLEEVCQKFVNYMEALWRQESRIPAQALPVWRRWQRLQQERRENDKYKRKGRSAWCDENGEQKREKEFVDAYQAWRSSVS